MDDDTIMVRVTFVVPVSRSAWSVNYGTGTKDTDVRKDVKAHIENSVLQQFEENGVLG